MALPAIGQAQLLGAALQRTVAQFQPRSLAVLGIAGGNGLELIERTSVRRIVALDFNPNYLEISSRRYAARFAEFEPVFHDLSRGPPAMTPVDCIFAGLVLEYICVDVFCDYLASLLTIGGTFATLLQLPSPTLPKISASPYTSLACLESVFSFIDPARLHDSLSAHGFARKLASRHDLDSGKSFYYASYQTTNRD